MKIVKLTLVWKRGGEGVECDFDGMTTEELHDIIEAIDTELDKRFIVDDETQVEECSQLIE